MRTDKIKMFMKILLLFMCSSVGNVFCSLWKLVFTTKLQTNNCQLQLTGYSLMIPVIIIVSIFNYVTFFDFLAEIFFNIFYGPRK